MINILQKYLAESDDEKLNLDMTSGYVLLLIDSSLHNVSTEFFKDDKFYAVKNSERKDALKAVRARFDPDSNLDIDYYAVFHSVTGSDDQVVIIHVPTEKTQKFSSKISFISVASTENKALEIVDKNPKLVHIKDEYEEGKRVYPVYVKLTH